MADLSIRNDFLGGTQEIFTTMFNDGVSDGLDLYLLSDKTKTSSYGESKVLLHHPLQLLLQKHHLHLKLNLLYTQRYIKEIRPQHRLLGVYCLWYRMYHENQTRPILDTTF